MSVNKKVYGLILSKKGQQSKEKAKPTGAFNVFGEDSDSDQDGGGTSANVPPSGGSMIMRKQAKIDIAKSLQEDPTVYQYDEIYDDMQASKPEAVMKEKKKQVKEKEPRYIVGLLKATEHRKKEEERRKERQVQKEREAEGAMYADKESFVTSAYKKKMLEMQEEEEREKREAALEAMTDVTKQRDMSGFYRYLYRETAGPEVKVEPEVKQELSEAAHQEEGRPQLKVEDEVKKEPMSPKSDKDSSASDSTSSSDEERSKSPTVNPVAPVSNFSKRSRPANTYRKQRKNSSSSEDGKDERKKGGQPERDSKSRSGARSPELDSRRKSRSPRPRSRSPRHRSGSLKQKHRYSSEQRSSHSPKRRSRSPKRANQRQRSTSRSPDHRRHSRRSDGNGDRSTKSIRSDRGEKSSRVSDRDSSYSTTSGRKERSNRNDRSQSKSPIREANGVESNSAISDQLKELRTVGDTVARPGKENKLKESDVKPKAAKPTDPKIRFPHHNSAKDIEEARKRYYQRKMARERQGVA